MKIAPTMKRLFLAVLTVVAAPAASCGAPNSKVSLEIAPAASLIDAPVTIHIANARSGTTVAIDARAQLFGNRFLSREVYLARHDGSVDVDSSTFLGAMHLDGKWHDVPFDPLAPRTITFHVANAGASVSKTITRFVLADGIKRFELRTSQLYGTGFIHIGPARRAAVVVLGGSEGGVPETRAALIASHGFNTLALAYFGVGPLPRALANVPIARVQTAVAWLQAQPGVDPSRIGILGASKGAELALLSAAHFSTIRAVVALKPSSVVFSGLFYEPNRGAAPSSWSFRGMPFTYVNGTAPASVEAQISADVRAKRPVSYMPEYLAEVRNATNLAESMIPVERIRGPVLLVTGDDDRLWPSSFMASQIIQRLRLKHHPYSDRWLHYANAGHGIGEAYDTYAESTTAGSLNLGGTPAGNARASADSWPRAIEFLSLALHA